jgi:hypothetical protein
MTMAGASDTHITTAENLYIMLRNHLLEVVGYLFLI